MRTTRSLLVIGPGHGTRRTLRWLAATAILAHVVGPTTPVSAGGSNYVVKPGARPHLAEPVREWAVPTPRLARDPAPGPDGTIYIAVMTGNKIARFDPSTERFQEWTLPAGATPHGLLVDRSGKVWYTGYGNGTIGRLDPATGETKEYKAPSGGHPHTIVSDDAGVLWFTNARGNRIGRLDPQSGAITEYPTRGNPYG
ncbi:MAG: virginiamycin B lyase family protein, partial [Actinomycetota bacterium]